MARTYEETIFDATVDAVNDALAQPVLPTPDEIKGNILDNSRNEVTMYNSIAQQGAKWKVPVELETYQIAYIMLRVHYIALIETTESEDDADCSLLGVYMEDGEDEGIYTTKDSEIRRIARLYKRKAVITGDTIQVNRKFKAPISFKFKGFMVQCLNEMPRVKDKSDSFYRRQLFIPFTKCFTGAERKYIKDDYLKRKEVVEYVMYKVLNMNYYEFDVPEACKTALEEYKEFNDPVRQFMAEIMPELQWDFVPFTFLYDLYKEWYKKYVGKQEVKSLQVFIKDVLNLLKDYPDWDCPDSKKAVRPKNMMDNVSGHQLPQTQS